MTKLLSSLTLAAALVFSTAACDVIELAAQAQTGRFERTLPISGPVVLEVRTGSGSIQIKTGPTDTVQVLGLIRAREDLLNNSAASRIAAIEKAPPIEQAGTTIRIGQHGNDPLYQNVSISYEITVPANSQIQSMTGSGSITIGNVRGSITAQTGSGSIVIAETAGDVNAQTGSGSIHARAVGGAIRAHTGSGDIEMRQTVPADAEMQTGSGDVQLILADNAAFDLVARTGSGAIHVTQPIATRVQSRNRLEGTVRGGGGRVTVHTGSGSITIR